MKTRYPGAQPFSTSQQPIFFGREEELSELIRHVMAEQMVVLFSKSGLGKSSLLNAGLIPEVKKEGRLQPVSIRFGAFTPGEPAGPLSHAIASIREEAKDTAPALEKIKPAREGSLWYHCKTRQLTADDEGFLLILDQFEELFTYSDQAVQDFGKQLSELLYTNIPDRFRERLESGLKADAAFLSANELQRLHQPFELHIVMAIRSDRMSLMNKLKTFLPNILENCYELTALSIEEAESAILSPAYLPQESGPFYSPVFDYEDEAVASLINFLSEGRTQEIESFQLQILCEHAEQQATRKNGKPIVTAADLADPELILENYYLGKIESLPEADRLAACRLIEEGLIFEEEERRLTLFEGQIARTYGISPELLRTLVDTHLIRSEPSLRGGYTYELSHDTLVAPVLRAKAKRLEEERREAEQAEQRRKEAEMEALRRRAEEEQQLRERAEANEQRARRRTRMAALVSILALALAVFAGWSYKEARTNAVEAEKQRKEALQQKAKAERETLNAEANARKAEEKTTEAEEAKEEAQRQSEIANQRLVEMQAAQARELAQKIDQFIASANRMKDIDNPEMANRILDEAARLAKNHPELIRKITENRPK